MLSFSRNCGQKTSQRGKTSIQDKSPGDQMGVGENLSFHWGVGEGSVWTTQRPSSGWDPGCVVTCMTHYLFKVMIFGERTVLFRARLSRLINGRDCCVPWGTLPGPASLPGASPGRGPTATDVWVTDGCCPVASPDRWPLMVGTRRSSNPIPNLFPDPIFRVSWGLSLHWECGSGRGAVSGHMSNNRVSRREATRPPHPSTLIWFTNLP